MIEELERALAVHKAKLEMVKEVAESTTCAMQRVLVLELETLDKQLKSWIKAAPISALIHQGEEDA